ncbi:uncharacterized protein LOC132316280 [Cornus florida]|uniref:uncharacterized protein LOC132316280 n=1 Tax=Cornus florida TaxID=4283 RepID=UPI0028A05F1F|nr:uncharacterized protein LOC132316280 [Cornus florida]
MDRDYKLKPIPSLKKLKSDSTIVREDSDVDDHQYTSLKDIIQNSPPHYATNNEPNGFDSSNISIRNELVKHAASAYVQSAQILTNRNQNCFANLWRKIENKVVYHSCWQLYVRKPLRACFHPIFRFLDCIVNGIGRSSVGGEESHDTPLINGVFIKV